MERTYKTALALLCSGSQKARPPPSSSSRNGKLSLNRNGILSSDEKPSFKWTPNLDGKPHWNGLGGMKENLQLLGYSDRELSRLNVIHVAGTKGKGSTCAFAHSFLKAHGERTGFPHKIGLYTSPHMLHTRERIRINFSPISEELFTKYFFEVWDKVHNHALQNSYRMPGCFQLLMLVSVHTFAKEGVDAAIYETHSGGEYCTTNISKPTVTGITTLGLDHTEVLGPLIENIAWHKSGIFKQGIPAFSSPQTPAAAEVLQQRADEKGVPLKFTGLDATLSMEALALEPEVQRVNASLALALTNEFLKVKAPNGGLTSQDVVRGIEQYSWPGRFHRIVDGSRQWFLDIAHNELSLKKAAHWFAKTTSATQSGNPPLTRILIFSHHSFRDGAALLECVAESLQECGVQMQHVIFAAFGEEGREEVPIAHDEDIGKEAWLDIQKQFAETWKRLDPKAQVSLQPSVYDALELAKRVGDRGNGMQTFVTGSTRLVGPSLDMLEGSTPDHQAK